MAYNPTFVTVILIAIVFSGVGVALIEQPNKSEVAQRQEQNLVVLTDAGYEPATLTINQGDTVWFTTNRALKHWPASNHHPIHEELPDFDPGRSLEPDESWNFTFTEKGTWEFHDHLYSHFTGVVIVK